MVSLRRLILTDENNLVGTLPSELSALTNLVSLDFDSNANLGGTLPAEFGGLIQLTSLDIDSGSFSGTIPESLYQLTNLEALDIDLNQFTGTLSTSIGNLVNLNVLQIDSNAFTGPVPSEINQLENLSEFNNCLLVMLTGAWLHVESSDSHHSYLSTSTGFFTTADTQMTGEILQYFEGRTELQILGVGENSFIGTIPTFFGEFAGLEVLSLLGNSFSGTIPTQLGNLNNLGMSHLVFPSEVLLIGSRLLTFSPYNCAENLFLHFNSFEGSMPSEICALRTSGQLRQLTSDCAGPNAAVQCEQPACCTACF